MKRILYLFFLCLIGGAPAAEPVVKQKIVPVQPLRISHEARDSIIRALTDAEPALKALRARFPDAKVAVSAAPPEKNRYAVTVSKTLEGYLVQMRVTAAFDENFAEPTDIKRASFTAVRVADVKALRPGQVLGPIWMSFERVDEFCAEPMKVISTSPVRTGPNTFVPQTPKSEEVK